MNNNAEHRGLYIHIPFCLSKCPYCDFYSVKYDDSTAKAYSEAVKRNIIHYGGSFDTIYFGGGTPILLWREICEILKLVRTSTEPEVTVEANPCCTDRENLSALFKAGVNRISFGIQSLDDSQLGALGRRHSSDDAVNAVKTAAACGFYNISADMMIGSQGQTVQGVTKTADMLSKLPIQHISVYMLKIEENTPFALKKPELPGEDEVCEMYLAVAQKLKDSGFEQYEISNFSRKGFECRHNLKYWNRDEYLGIGPAAHSHYNGTRFFTERNLSRFIESQFQSSIPEDDCGWTEAQEYAMLRLRLSEGLYMKEYGKRGGNINEFIKRLDNIPNFYFNYDNDRVALTAEGFLVSNAVIGLLIGP